jgi:hypothetical protein
MCLFIAYQIHIYYKSNTVKDEHYMEQQVINVEVYSIQHYVIKFVSDLRQVCCFLYFL